MRDTDGAPDTAPLARIGLGARFFGTVFWPKETFERVAADPRWAGILILSAGLLAAISGALVSTDVMQRAILDQQMESMAAFGVETTDEISAQMERQNQNAPIFTAVAILISLPIITLIASGLLFAIGYGLLGARATFRQMFAINAHAGVILVVTQFFVAPLNYVRGAADSPATLAAFAPMLETGTFAFNLLKAIDLTHVWWVMVLAIGLAILWRCRTTPVAITLYAIQLTLAVAFAAARTAIGF